MSIMKKSRKSLLAVSMCLFFLSGCGVVPSYDDFDTQVAPLESLEQVSDCFSENDYDERSSIIATTKQEYVSDNGLCVLKDMGAYYDVTLDFENGTHGEVAKAYGECILQAVGVDATDFLEGYIYENIHMAFPELTEDYSPVWTRTEKLLKNMPEEYMEELNALAETVSGGEHGLKEDGRLSYEEMVLANLIPDVLRGTACFSLSVWGTKTEDATRYSARVMEWNVGSERQSAKVHAVLHMKNGEKSYTAIGFLGLLDVLTGINDQGVLIACLDVREDQHYNSEGKFPYTWDMRYALENYDQADLAADFFLSRAGKYTYNPNIMLGDANVSYCVELCNEPEKAPAVLRTVDSVLTDNLSWSVPDSMCIINDYVVQGTGEKMTQRAANYNRWRNAERWLTEKDKVKLSDMKELVTRENLFHSEKEGEGDAYMIPVQIYSSNMVHIAIVDYSTGEIHVAFASKEGKENRPDFYIVGKYFDK